ncbi:hypothetical protein B0F90DRAFT_1815955 [Multifurca ochricompacta]|uniref:Uncharacterized protein n=1 Tax=Multifurca ochricompacta TaxID=376703 RepID=A0AAD4M8R4_9AGAM|nr:hypothetical protein B0F90DRAFT_1815955 [Multifurca ochricompacta]
MAGPLRKVSRNYNWTLRRAHNDLHNSITTPRRQQQPELASLIITESSSVSRWDSNRLQWKFRSEYEELRGHLGHSFIILFNWLVTIYHLAKVASRDTIGHRAIALISNHGLKVPSLDLLPIHIWGLLVMFLQYAAPLEATSLQYPPFSSPIRLDTNSNAKARADAFPAPVSAGQSLSALTMDSPRTPGNAPPFAKDDGRTTASGPIHSVPDVDLIDALKDGIEILHSAMHGEGKESSHGYFDTENRHEPSSVLLLMQTLLASITIILYHKAQFGCASGDS